MNQNPTEVELHSLYPVVPAERVQSARKYFWKPLLWASMCTVIGFVWQVLMVYGAYHGNWSALFHHGFDIPVPHDTVFSSTYVFPTYGYDGVFYRMVAHDPFAQRGYAHIMAMPQMRYRRILIPALAYLSAAGNQHLIDSTYLMWLLISIWLGTYWLAKYLKISGYNSAWSCCYLAFPSVLSALELATIDVALTSLAIGLVYYWSTTQRRVPYWLLMLAPLIRETGIVLPLAALCFEIIRRHWFRAAACLATLLPAFAWFLFVKARIPAENLSHFNYFPLGHFWYHLLHHDTKPDLAENIAMQIGYYLGILGMLLAFALSWWAWRRTRGLIALAALGFTAVAICFDSTGLWLSVKHFGRVFSPLVLLLALQYPALKRPIFVAPLLLEIPGSLLFSLTPLKECLQGFLRP